VTQGSRGRVPRGPLSSNNLEQVIHARNISCCSLCSAPLKLHHYNGAIQLCLYIIINIIIITTTTTTTITITIITVEDVKYCQVGRLFCDAVHSTSRVTRRRI